MTPKRIAIVGAAAAGLAAAEAARSAGYDGELVMIGEEKYQPYDRPPLSKQVLLGEWTFDRIALRGAAELDRLGLDLRLGVPASGLDADAREVALADGSRVGYEALVVATGVRPRLLPGTAGVAGVYVLRDVGDALALRERLTPGARLVVIGAGVLGSEVDWLRGSTVPLDGSTPAEGTGGVLCAPGGQATEGVYAAGDVAAWRKLDGDGYSRVEHRLNATEQGRAVARAILDPTADHEPTVPYFWSDQYGLKIQSYGLPSPDDEFVVVEGTLAERRFVAAYVHGGLVSGALGIGLPRQLRAWRALVGHPLTREHA